MVMTGEALRRGDRRPVVHDPLAAPRIARLLVVLLMVTFVAQAGMAALRDSVIVDEFVGLPVGLYTLQAVDFRSESMNPPFFRSFAALPLLTGGTLAPRIPPMNEGNDWAMGSIVRSFQGRMQIASEVGSGTTVSIQIPLAETTPSAPAA